MTSDTTTSRPISADRPGGRVRRLTAAAWRPAAALYLVVLLGALAAGLFPSAVAASRLALPTAAVPALPAVAVGQVAFFLIVLPLVQMRRAERDRPPAPAGSPGRARLAGRAVECAALLAAGVPFYVVGGWFSDASVLDGVRTALCAAACVPLALAAGSALARGGVGASWVMIGLLLFVLGAPALYYVARDFAAPHEPLWPLWNLPPATWAYANAAGRIERPWPAPLWPIAVQWALAAGVAALARRKDGPAEAA